MKEEEDKASADEQLLCQKQKDEPSPTLQEISGLALSLNFNSFPQFHELKLEGSAAHRYLDLSRNFWDRSC